VKQAFPFQRPRRSARWRRTRARGVSDILATILLVAITVVLAAVLYILISHYTAATSVNPSLESSLALSAPQESVSPDSVIAACSANPCNFYNISVQSAAAGMELKDLVFEIVAQNGSIYLPTGGVVIQNSAGAIVGKYTFPTGWTSGPTSPVTDLLTIVLYTSGNPAPSLSGEQLRVVGVNSYSGSDYVRLP
jgi:flagellin-like protein